MSRGRDLTDQERVFVHNKIMQNWDSKRRRIKVGGRKIVLNVCINGGVRVCQSVVNRIAREAKRQEDETEKHYSKTGTVKGMDHGATRKGNCGRISKLTEPVKVAYREIISRNDLGFFASLKVDVKRMYTHCTSRAEMMVNVMKAFEEYPREKIDGIWACWFNNLCSVMACDGRDDYKQAHNGGKRRKRETGSACDLAVNLVDYDRCVRLCR